VISLQATQSLSCLCLCSELEPPNCLKCLIITREKNNIHISTFIINHEEKISVTHRCRRGDLAPKIPVHQLQHRVCPDVKIDECHAGTGHMVRHAGVDDPDRRISAGLWLPQLHEDLLLSDLQCRQHNAILGPHRRSIPYRQRHHGITAGHTHRPVSKCCPNHH
jgi:hypothetical protein